MSGDEPVVVPFPEPGDSGQPRVLEGPPAWSHRKRGLAVVGLALLGALAYTFHVRSTALAALGWFSTLPWLLLAVHPRLRGRGNTWAFLGSVYLAWVIAISWLQPFGTAAWLVGSWLYVPLFLPAFWMAAAVRRQWPRFPLAVLWAVAFTGTEWFRVRASPGELALALLGYSQIAVPKLVQVADLAGVAAVTFMLAAFTGLAGEVLVLLATTPGERRPRRLVPQAVGVATLVAAVVAYGFVRDTEEHFSEGPTLHVLQAALPHGNDPDAARRIYDLHVLQTLSTAKPELTDAVLWPENSVMLPILQRQRGLEPELGADLVALAQRLGQPILIDGTSVSADTTREYHSAVLIRPDGTFDAYDKVRPLPWTEALPGEAFVRRLGDGPLEAWKRFVAAFVGFVPAATPGDPDELAPMRFVDRDGQEWSFGTPLCFEIGTTHVVNRWHRQGVDFLVNQASEGLLGDTVHAQTIVVSGFRAIEARVSVIRATNDGISALIDPNGRVRSTLRGRQTGSPINEGGAFYPTVVLDARRGTLFVRLGEWLGVSCFLAGLALWGTAAWRHRRDRKAPRTLPRAG